MQIYINFIEKQNIYKKSVMEKKKIYHITESQAAILIQEQMADPNLTGMLGAESNRLAHNTPINTGKFDDKVGVGAQQKDEPKKDLRQLPKSFEIQKAYAYLQKAANLILNGAPKLTEESLRSRIEKLHAEINKIMMKINGEINVNEIDLTT